MVLMMFALEIPSLAEELLRVIERWLEVALFVGLPNARLARPCFLQISSIASSSNVGVSKQSLLFAQVLLEVLDLNVLDVLGVAWEQPWFKVVWRLLEVVEHVLDLLRLHLF